MNLERKFCKFEVKEADDSGHIVGYGSVFGNTDHGGDVVERGAFTESLKTEMPLMLWSHNFMEPPVGEWTKAQEDDHGLLLEGDLYVGVNEKVDLIHRGMQNKKRQTGLSIGYNAKVWEYNEDEDVRHLKVIDLKEVSPVNFPMNDRATVLVAKARHALQNGDVPSERDLEALLREAGLSRDMAKALIAGGHGRIRAARGDASEDELKEAVETAAELRRILGG